MKALVFERSVPRFVAARIASSLTNGKAAKVGPLRHVEITEPPLPADEWIRVTPLLSGICGSDLATIDAKSSRYFEDIVSFPFVPGHEVVGRTEDGRRVVLQPALSCEVRGLDLCGSCANGDVGSCQYLAHGSLEPGLQTGYCSSTGGGWSASLVAHPSQLFDVPDDLSDEAAVVVEPIACAIHAALRPGATHIDTAVVLGAGTIGLGVIAALKAFCNVEHIIATAKYPHQKVLAKELGADRVVSPSELRRAVRSRYGSSMVGDRLTGGTSLTYDCVGSSASLDDAFAISRSGAEVVLAGMPAPMSLDLTPVWHKQLRITGAYAYGNEVVHQAKTFDLAFDLVRSARLERLVSATYRLDRYEEAIEHAANAGRRGAIKVAFDLRGKR